MILYLIFFIKNDRSAYKRGIIFILLLAGCHPNHKNTIPIEQSMLFRHYTLALTWQPSFYKNINPDMSENHTQPLIGVHGLWASEPFTLEKQHIPVLLWWQKGCALYPHQGHNLTTKTQNQIYQIVSDMPKELIAHEYHKHMQCFYMQPISIFSLAHHMRLEILNSHWGQWLISQAGKKVTKQEIIKNFEKEYGALPQRGLQMQCLKNKAGMAELSQFWFTLKTTQLASFPDANAFLSSPHQQDNCPNDIYLVR